MCRLRVDSARLGRPDPPEHPSLTAEQEVCKYVVARSVQSAPRLLQLVLTLLTSKHSYLFLMLSGLRLQLGLQLCKLHTKFREQ